MAYVPVIDEGSCIAHAECEEVAPDVFHVDDVATVVGTAPLQTLTTVAEACPTSAITLIDDETGEQIYP